MQALIHALRIIAALMLMGAGLGLLGALVHSEIAMHGPAVAKARRSNTRTVPAGTPNHSRHHA